MYHIIIIGGGPAGLNAALYAGRAGLKALVIEKLFSGGQAATTHQVDNYLGFPDPISGPDLVMKMEEHALKFGAEIIHQTVEAVDFSSAEKSVTTESGTYTAPAVILAMGAAPRPLGVPGEQEFRGRGVSYCATCDGNFYRGRTAMVVGGGDTAAEDALYLANLCETVYLVHRRDKLRAAKSLADSLSHHPNIRLLMNATLDALEGDTLLRRAMVRQNGTLTPVATDGLFVAVGTQPASHLVQGVVATDRNGYILTDPEMRTSLPGVYAAGDIRQKSLRQIITAVSDGALAVNAIQTDLAEGKI